MSLQSLQKQFLRDLKASWQKTAVLVVLLIVGLVFWIPPLVRAVVGETAASPVVAVAPVETAPVPSATEPTPETSQNATAAVRSWKMAEELLQSDPLVRSAEVAAISSDPFRIDQDQFPPPILFAADPNERAEAQRAKSGQADTAGAKTFDGVVLKSTILGVKRRAAFINSKLYFEGTEVRLNGEAYRLAAVHPRSVVLTRGNETFELKITSRSKPENIHISQE